MTATEFERSIGDPPEVMASMEAYLADRREFDSRYVGRRPGASGPRGSRREARRPRGLVTRPHALRGSIDAMFEYRPMDVLGRAHSTGAYCGGREWRG